MGIRRPLIISFLTLTCIAPLAGQTNELPRGCVYMSESVRPLKNPFPHPVLFRAMPVPQDGISLTSIGVPPQFQARNRRRILHLLPTEGESGVNRRLATGTDSRIIACGFH